MRKIILIEHTSLDGYVAGPNGELEWFPTGEENLQFVCELTRTADTALFGRLSYELLESYWPGAKDEPDASKGTLEYSSWYNRAQRIVVSRTMKDKSIPNGQVIADDVENGVRRIKEQQGKDILVFGSTSVARLLLDAGLVDECWIFVNALLFGKGIPLFKPNDRRTSLKLAGTRAFENDEFGLHYLVRG